MHQALSRLSVYVVEDSPLVLRRLVALIESGGLAQVVGTSDVAISALLDIPALAPDVVLVDLHLRDGSGMDVIAGLTGTGCKATKIVLTNPANPAVRQAARAAGADYFYDKTAEFMLAVRTIGDIARDRIAGLSGHTDRGLRNV